MRRIVYVGVYESWVTVFVNMLIDYKHIVIYYKHKWMKSVPPYITVAAISFSDEMGQTVGEGWLKYW